MKKIKKNKFDVMWKDWAVADARIKNERRDERVRWVEEQIKTKNVKTILDVACGPGWHVKFLHDKGYDVKGVDISPVAINFGLKQWPDLDLSVLKADKITELESFDAILCLSSLNVFKNHTEILRKFSRSGKWGYFSMQDYKNHHTHLRKYTLKTIGELFNPYCVTKIEKIRDFWMVEVHFQYEDWGNEDTIFKRENYS